MDILEMFLTNGKEITFSVLFVAMLIWVMRTNQDRETRYRDREDNIQKINGEREDRYQQTITDLTSALKGYEDVKKTVDEINNKLK